MTPERAHEWTDKALRRLEKRIKAAYTATYREIKSELAVVLQKITVSPNMSLQEKMIELQKYDRLRKVCAKLAVTVQSTTKDVYKALADTLGGVYTENYNAYADELGLLPIAIAVARESVAQQKSPFTVLAEENRSDKRTIERQLQSRIVQGVLMGRSYDIYAQVKSMQEELLRDAVRISRTEVTRIENTARLDAGKELEEDGLKVWKRWISEKDRRTRKAHVEARGQERRLNEPFIVGGEKLMFPADVSLGATAGNVINCRCTMELFTK